MTYEPFCYAPNESTRVMLLQSSHADYFSNDEYFDRQSSDENLLGGSSGHEVKETLDGLSEEKGRSCGIEVQTVLRLSNKHKRPRILRRSRIKRNIYDTNIRG